MYYITLLTFHFRALEEDRYLQPEIQEVIRLVRENRVWETVAAHIEKMEKLEDDHPDALRQECSSPTGGNFAPRGFESAL